MNSKEFDEQLQLKNFDKLEESYQHAKNFFLHLNDNITCVEVSQRFPAFCLYNREIRIKFPTYFIRIINRQIPCSDLEKLLNGQGNYYIYEEPNVIKLSTFEPVHSLAIHCLEPSLTENTTLAERIENILKQNNITTERCVSSGHYLIPIKVNENGYIKVIKD